MNSDEVRHISIREVQGLHRRFGYRLFGRRGIDCLNMTYIDKDGITCTDNGHPRGTIPDIFSSYYSENGILGDMKTEIEQLKADNDDLKELVDDLVYDIYTLSERIDELKSKKSKSKKSIDSKAVKKQKK